jgi:dTDP-4-amino-4,6-dideoxygalactose transaminase
MKSELIPYNKPFIAPNQSKYLNELISHSLVDSDGHFSKDCQKWINNQTGCLSSLLTPSCTAALEMSAIALNLKVDDEIIMPSYTFSSSASAFVLRGAKPVFIDVRKDTLNIDETLIEDAITKNTKAILVVHYAGVACEMDKIIHIAKKYNIPVIEDAAQGVMSSYKGNSLGSIGNMGAYSFHSTKNIISGEGGALLINDKNFLDSIEIIREKGTDRSKFLRGEVDKYTWQDVGSSFLPSEITSAFLLSQLEYAKEITNQRLEIYKKYYNLFEDLESKGVVYRPKVTQDSIHNAHIFYIILNNSVDREKLILQLKKKGIYCTSHYVPLHSSPAGIKYCRQNSELVVTNRISEKILRLPLWVGLTSSQQQYVHESIHDLIN